MSVEIAFSNVAIAIKSHNCLILIIILIIMQKHVGKCSKIGRTFKFRRWKDANSTDRFKFLSQSFHIKVSFDSWTPA